MLSDLLRSSASGLYADPTAPYGPTTKTSPVINIPTAPKVTPANGGTLPPIVPPSSGDSLASLTTPLATGKLGVPGTTQGIIDTRVGDNGSITGPGDPAPAVDPFAQQLTALYHAHGRGDPTPAEIEAHRTNPGGLSAIAALLDADNARAASGGGQSQHTPAPTVYNANTVLPVLQRYAHTPAGLQQAFAENPDFFKGATITGSKGSKIQFADGRVVQVVQSAGLGGVGWTWDEGGGTDAGSTAAIALPANLFDTWGQTYVDPDYQAGNAPVYTAPDVPVIDAWKAPTAGDLTQDPSYQWRLAQGLGAIQNSRAAQRTSRTGAALQALNDYAGNSASQEYQSVWARDKSAYDTGVANQFAAWKDQQDKASSEYAPKLLQYQTAVADAQRRNQNSWDAYLQQYAAWDAQRRFLASTLQNQAQLGLSAASA